MIASEEARIERERQTRVTEVAKQSELRKLEVELQLGVEMKKVDSAIQLAAKHNAGMEHYSLFLFAGMVPWSFLSISLNECAVCIIQNEGLIRKIYLPKLVFPLCARLDRPGDVRAVAGVAVPAALAAGGQAVRRRCCSCRWRSRSWPCSRSVSA